MDWMKTFEPGIESAVYDTKSYDREYLEVPLALDGLLAIPRIRSQR